MSDPVDFDVLADLVDSLVAGGIRSVALDRGAVNLPGVWVRVVDVDVNTLDGYLLNLELIAMTGDKDTKRALADLGELFNKIDAVVDVLAPARTATITMPDDLTRLPGLVVPYALAVC